MTLKFNPLSKKGLDYFLHQGIASYRFTGFKELAELTDPGAGNFYINYDFGGIGDMYAVVSLTDSHGYWMTWNWMMVYEGMAWYDIFLQMHGKTNSDQYMTFIIIPDEEWIDITEGEGEDEVSVALAIPIWEILFPLIEDGDDVVVDEFPENDEVLFSVDFSWNQDCLGSMASQDSDGVSITGGDISGVNMWGGDGKTWTLPYKIDTGDPVSVSQGKIYDNRFDKLIRIYLDEAWRTLLDYN